MKSPSDLEPEQIEAIEWLKFRSEALLALPIGFGKTVVTLTALKEIFNVHPEWRALLVSTSNICKHTWVQEMGEWSHLHGVFSYTSLAGRVMPEGPLDSDILAINFESLEWFLDLVDSDQVALPEVLIIDESSKMKAHDAQRVQRLAGLRRIEKKNGVRRYKNYPGYIDRFERRILMSGTPAPEGYGDLWAQSCLLSTRRRLGENITSFRDQYASRDRSGFGWVVDKHAEALIEEKLKYVMYLPKEESDYGLPPVLHRAIEVPWSPDARAQYLEMEKQAEVILSGLDIDLDIELDQLSIEAPNAGVVYSKLRQLCSGFIYDDQGNTHWTDDKDAKGDALELVLDGLAGTPILVFTQFTAEAEYLRDRFDFHVGMPNSIQDWTDQKIPRLCLHPASAGHGLNMQYGSHVCLYYSMPVSHEQWRQSFGRLQRRGQPARQVSALRLQRPNSVELDVWNSVQGKRTKLSDLLRNMRQRRAQLSASD